MLFNSFEFLLFFPVVTALFFLLPHRFRWVHLLIASCTFYMAFVPLYILILLTTIVIDYFAGIFIERVSGRLRKVYLVISLASNIGILCVFKYYNFFADNINDVFGYHLPLLKILLPIGLSFHTFQAMSYIIEVYRGNQQPERHFGIYALYVMFYPQLVAGPIERPQNVLHQFHEQKTFNYSCMISGLRLMLWGMIKKVVIADNLALFTNPVFNNSDQYNSSTTLIAVLFFSFQIYCDFSGYSDIAIGSARVMGYKLMNNFDMPYFARSISEFWRRWHISLSTWFKDYLYIPLGGNRVGISRGYLNLFIVFLISGLWHGANWTFIVWGAIHGLYLISGSLIANAGFLKGRVGRSLQPLFPIIIFILVSFAWVFFRASSMEDAFSIISSVSKLSFFKESTYTLASIPIEKIQLLKCVLLVCFLLISEVLILKGYARFFLFNNSRVIRWGFYYALIAILLFGGVWGEDQFIYFQF